MALDLTDPTLVFGAFSALVFLGFVGNLIFRRFRLNDTLLLILVGVFLGPVLGVVPLEQVAVITPLVGPLALILILFDGGLALRFRDLLSGLGGAAVLGLSSFILSTAAVAGLTSYLLDIPFMTAAILGAILAGTSALVVMPSLQNIDVQKKTKTVLGLESALTDVLVVIVAGTLILITAAGQDPDAGGIAGSLVNTFIVAIAVGAGIGLGWLAICRPVVERTYGSMVTLGIMFTLYLLVENILVEGGGALAVLAFGVMLGNGSSLGPWFKERITADFTQNMQRFQGEVAFLVRTFFFVYLGALVEPGLFADPTTLSYGILVFIALGAARYVSVVLATGRLRLDGDAAVLWIMMPRGLAAAVLAAGPAALGIPGTERFVAISFMALVLTNASTTAGTLVLEKRATAAAAGNVAQQGGKSGVDDRDHDNDEGGPDDTGDAIDKALAKARRARTTPRTSVTGRQGTRGASGKQTATTGTRRRER